MFTDQIKDLLWALSLVLPGMWAAQLWRLGLRRRYAVLFSYLVAATTLQTVGYALQGIHTEWLDHQAYFWFWVVSQPVLWLLLFGVVYECFEKMAEGYAGLRRVGQLIAFGLVGALIAVVGFVLLLDPFDNPEPKYWYRLILVQQQSVYLATAISVALLVSLRRLFRLPVPRNVAVTMAALGVYVGAVSAMTAMRAYWGAQLNQIHDIVGLAVYCTCILGGAIAFSRHGESRRADERRTALARTELQLARSVERLEQIEGDLLRAVR